MMSKIVNVDNIIQDIFFNDTEQALNKLKEYNLYEIIEKHINSINPDLDNFTTIATSLLTSINAILKSISNKEDKNNLEYLISEIANYIIKRFFKEDHIDNNQIKQLDNQIKTICDLNGYNYTDLQKLVPLQLIFEFITINQNRNEKTKNAYYEWTKKNHILDELAKNLKSEKIIYSVKEFKKMFSSQPVKVIFNKEKIEFIIVLFDELYSLSFIKPRVKKGHFIALKENGIDQDQKLLFEKDIKHLNYSIKQNTTKHDKIKRKIRNWLDIK